MPCSNTKNNLWEDVFLSLIRYCITAAEFLVDFPMPNPLSSPLSGHRCLPGLCHISQHEECGWALVKVEAVGRPPQGQQTSLAVLQIRLQQQCEEVRATSEPFRLFPRISVCQCIKCRDTTLKQFSVPCP